MFLSKVIIRWWFIQITIHGHLSYSPWIKIVLSRVMLKFFHEYLFVVEVYIYFPVTGEWLLEEVFE